MSVTGISSTAGTTGTGGAATPKAGGMLGKDDFLKLLVGQLRHQDPMSPSGDQEYIQQMTSFSMLEQITNLAATNQQLAEELRTQQTLGLIGKTVTYTNAEGATASGVVEKVDLTAEGPRLTIGGVPGIAPAAVTEVR